MKFHNLNLSLLMACGLIFFQGQSQLPDEDLRERAKTVLGKLDEVPQERLGEPIVELGQRLFWDRRLSANGKIACASCHTVEAWGADRERYSVDARGNQTKRHSQTVFNSTLQPRLRWVADRKSAADQAEKSLTGSMGFDRAEDVIPLLVEHCYGEKFGLAFPEEAAPVTPKNYALAIDAYEETLKTPAPFDHYLGEDPATLSDQQKRGLQLFLDIGCADCHSGPLLGGNDLQTFGIYQDYWLATGSEQRDAGLFESTNEESDRNLFRVSMLRNIAKTAPYFHDGSVNELSDAVRIMAKVQLDKELDDAQTADLVAFLESLTGVIPVNYRDPFESGSLENLNTEQTFEKFKIQSFGTMREAIGLGQNQGRVNLGRLAQQPHFFAVGALAGLRGEITIFDSKIFVSTVNPSGELSTAIGEDADALQATLLIGAQVVKWTEHQVPQDITFEKLDQFIADVAGQQGLDINQPIPFVIEGNLSDVHVHVINGACPVHSKRNQLEIPATQKPFDQESNELSGQVVGIFAANAAGRMTHPGTQVHAHLIFKTDADQIATGHLEKFGARSGAVLRLPSIPAKSKK